MDEGSAALWFSASRFELLDFDKDGVELVAEVQTSTTVVASPSVCGNARDRWWVTRR